MYPIFWEQEYSAAKCCRAQARVNAGEQFTYLRVCVCPSASAPPAAPSSPNDVLEALEQRRAKYMEASSQAKAKGDDRKARMHDRISKVSVGPRAFN